MKAVIAFLHSIVSGSKSIFEWITAFPKAMMSELTGQASSKRGSAFYVLVILVTPIIYTQKYVVIHAVDCKVAIDPTVSDLLKYMGGAELTLLVVYVAGVFGINLIQNMKVLSNKATDNTPDKTTEAAQ